MSLRKKRTNILDELMAFHTEYYYRFPKGIKFKVNTAVVVSVIKDISTNN